MGVEFDKLVLELRERLNWENEEHHDNDVGLFFRGPNKSDDIRNADDDILQAIFFKTDACGSNKETFNINIHQLII